MQYRFWKYFQVELGANQTDTRDLTNDRPLEGRPLWQGTANFITKLPGGFEIFIRSKRVDRRPFYSTTSSFAGSSTALIDNALGSSNRVVYGRAFTFLSFRIEKKFWDGDAGIFLGADNVLDAHELVYNPIKPRFYYLGCFGRF